MILIESHLLRMAFLLILNAWPDILQLRYWKARDQARRFHLFLTSVKMIAWTETCTLARYPRWLGLGFMAEETIGLKTDFDGNMIRDFGLSIPMVDLKPARSTKHGRAWYSWIQWSSELRVWQRVKIDITKWDRLHRVANTCLSLPIRFLWLINLNLGCDLLLSF